MKKRLVLTSLVAVWCVCPIFAARGEAFPTDGYMLENKTYAKAATYDNMGVYDGTVTARAKYEEALYQIAAGTYLPAGGEAAEQCPANSYCPGITDATYNESAAQGVTSCPDGYPNSVAGASTDTQCYTACTVGSANIAHATAVSGNDYYDTGVDTCAPTACENGYHVAVDSTCEITRYQIAAGTYLPAGGEAAKQCPANSYCPGITDATYNESTAQGVTACPSGYPNSVAGASTDTQCYTACTVDMVEHATAVDGNDYYGTGVDTCVVTACENGYHLHGVVESTIEVVEQTPLIDVDYTVGPSDGAIISADGSNEINADTYGLTENNTWASAFDYGVVYGRASCQPAGQNPGIEYVRALLNSQTAPDLDQVRSDLTPIVGAAKANYMADVIAGMMNGSLGIEALFEAMYVVFGSSKDALFSTTDTGQYCYCQMTGYRASGATETLEVDSASAPWVFGYAHSSADDCANMCAVQCVETQFRLELFRGAVYGALGVAASGDGYSTCAGNEITINWTDATEADIAENNAGMCTYGGEVRTPLHAATKPGKTFVGWKFNKN